MSDYQSHSGQVQLWRRLHWTQTWLSLHEQQLKFFKRAEEETPLLVVCLHGAVVIEDDSSLIITNSAGKVHIRLQGNAEKQDWLRYIQAAIQSAPASSTSTASQPSGIEKVLGKLNLGSFLGHSSKCVECGSSIKASDSWPNSHPERPYHKQCWDAHCSKALQPGPYLQQWAEAHPNAEVPELAHILAVMVKQPLPDGVATLLKMYPSLPTKPISGEGYRTAFHLAARRGDLPMLKMLERNSNRLDYGWAMDERATKSILLKGHRDAKDDVYIPQPGIALNSQPVFLGHIHGWYLFYYDPDAEGYESDVGGGWYVDAKLGFVRSDASRVPLPDPLDFATPFDAEESDETHGLTVQWLPHLVSVLDEAIASGNTAMIKEVIRCYKEDHIRGTFWKHYTGSGLWDVYPVATQSKIHEALLQNESKLVLNSDEHTARPVQLDFQQMQQTSAHHKAAIKSEIRALFQYHDSESGPLIITSDITDLESHDAAVLFSPLHGADVAPDGATLELLVAEGALDFSMWCPPCDPKHCCSQIQSPALREMSQLISGKEVEKLIAQEDCLRETPVPRATSERQSAFYSADYCAVIETLPFCAQLPANPYGMRFELDSIIRMAVDALMKIYEAQRQHLSLSASDVTAIFVHTYELPYDHADGSQIYREMNNAMRNNVVQLIDFWRPMIWRLDQVLQKLPPFAGRLYRGIKVTVSPAEFQVGKALVWPFFGIATEDSDIAEEFSRSATVGTLFIIESISAKSVFHTSRFYHDAEFLFAPGSQFEITSTLFTSESSSPFYGKCDNIALKQIL